MDFINKLRNSPVFLPLLTLVLCSLMYYLWSFSIENKTLFETNNILNQNLRVNKDKFEKSSIELSMCKSKESAFKQSNRDLQVAVAKSDDTLKRLNKEIQNSRSKKDSFFGDIMNILDNLLDGGFERKEENVYSDVMVGMQTLQAQIAESLNTSIKLEEMQSNISALQKEIDQEKTEKVKYKNALEASEKKVTKLTSNIEQLKLEAEKASNTRGLKLKKTETNPNVRMIDTNNKDTDANLVEKVINTESNADHSAIVSTTTEGKTPASHEANVSTTTAATAEVTTNAKEKNVVVDEEPEQQTQKDNPYVMEHEESATQ